MNPDFRPPAAQTHKDPLIRYCTRVTRITIDSPTIVPTGSPLEQVSFLFKLIVATPASNVCPISRPCSSLCRPSCKSQRSIRSAPAAVVAAFTVASRREPVLAQPVMHALSPSSRRHLRIASRLVRRFLASCSTHYFHCVIAAIALLSIVAHWLDTPPQSIPLSPALPLTPHRRRHLPTVEIFAAPCAVAPFTAHASTAVFSSWHRLHPRPRITLLGDAPRLSEVAHRWGFGHDPLLDHTFLSRPIYSSMIHRANRSRADVTVLLHRNLLLLPDFLPAIHKLFAIFPHFLAVGARYDVDHLPVFTTWSETQREFAQRTGALANLGTVDFLAWTTGGPRLVRHSVPPFIFGQPKFDNWFVHEAVATAARPVVDLSEVVVPIHINTVRTSSDGLASKNISIPRAATRHPLTLASTVMSSRVEMLINTFLSHTGSFAPGLGTPRHAPWKLGACHEPGGTCLVHRRRVGLCACEYTPSVARALMDPKFDRLGRPRMHLSTPLNDCHLTYTLPTRVVNGAGKFGLPLTLEDALEAVAMNGTVIVSAVNYGYRHIMMNWVCHMRRLSMSNFIIAALDEDTYRFALSHGIATYFEDSFDKHVETHLLGEQGEYGSVQFKRLTKMKTRVVARILRMGYDVVWSDTDIMFFRNPLPELLASTGDLVVQSNAPDSEATNALGRLNSGFYLARSKPRLIRTLDEVIRHALRSRKSEQPCFYDILCGMHGQRRLGDDMCIYKGVRTTFLDRSRFPNGATYALWNMTTGRILRRYPNLVVLHNNWVIGLDVKQERMRKHGFLLYDEVEDVCRFEDYGETKTFLGFSLRWNSG